MSAFAQEPSIEFLMEPCYHPHIGSQIRCRAFMPNQHTGRLAEEQTLSLLNVVELCQGETLQSAEYNEAADIDSDYRAHRGLAVAEHLFDGRIWNT